MYHWRPQIIQENVVSHIKTIAVNFEPEPLSHGVTDFPFFHVTHCVIGKTDLSQSKNKHKPIAISVAVEGRAGFMASSKLGLGAVRLWLYMLMRMGPDHVSTFQTCLQTAKQFTKYSLENSWLKCWTFTVILEFQQSNPVFSVGTLAYNGVHQDMLGLIGVGLMGVHQNMLGLMGSAG